MTAERSSLSTDTLRGAACVLVVLFHAVGDAPDRGLHIADGAVLRTLVESLQHIRMPLFTFLSGVVYALRPVGMGGEAVFIAKKARRLIAPLLVVATLFYCTRQILYHEPIGLDLLLFPFTLFFNSYQHFWFVQALFVVFVVVALLERFRLLEWGPRYAGTLAAASALFLVQPLFAHVDILSNAAYLAPFFLLGARADRIAEFLFRRRLVSFLIAVGVALFTLDQFAIVFWLNSHVAWEPLFALSIGGGVCLTLFVVQPNWRPLARLGAYSYSIYLFHVFGTAAANTISRIAWGEAPPLALALVFAVTAGICAPIVIDVLARRSPLLSWPLLGRRAAAPPQRMGEGVTSAGDQHVPAIGRAFSKLRGSPGQP